MNIVRECRYGKMTFNTNDTYVGKSYDLYGEYSEHEIKLLKKIVKPGNIVVDVGANIGALTIPLAQSAGREGIVLAFEPQRMSYYGLCGNVYLNNLTNVFCYQRAIGKESGTVKVPDLHMHIPGNYGAFSFLKLDAEPYYKQCNWLPVEIITIDDLQMAACDLIKIDVEGMELDVLDGAEKTINDKRPILYIEDDRPEYVPILLDWLKAHDYQAWQHFPPLFNQENMKKSTKNVFNSEVSANVLCYPVGKNPSDEVVNGLQLILKHDK